MTHEITNYGHSIRMKLLNVADRMHQPFMKVLPRYFQERLLYRLSVSEFRNNFLLKGDALLYAFYNYDARPTIDIDFLGEHINRDIETLEKVFSEVMKIKCPEDGVVFDVDTINATEITMNRQYNGIQLSFVARLDTIVQPMSIDIGFGEIVSPCAKPLEYPTLLKNMPEVDILAYSLEAVIAEKFEAMISLGEKNSRMKDFFDVYRLLKDTKVNPDDLSISIQNTFKNRGTIFIENHPLFENNFFKDPRREGLWKSFLKKIKWHSQINFQDVGGIIIKSLKPIYDELRK